MNYQVFDPDDALQPFIKCFWTLEDDGSENGKKQRIVPDGCMEMIFHFGDPYCQYFEDGSFIIQPRSFIFGQITHFIEIAPTGKSGIISARFLPEGLQPFLEIPVSSLENRATDLVDIFGEVGTQLERQVIDAGGTAQRIELIEAFLLSRLQQPQTIDAVIKNCVEVIISSQGKLGVMALAEKMNIKRRNMERKFNAVIGMSPKQLSRVVRLQATKI
jgi:AraC-like DNA-binding protein